MDRGFADFGDNHSEGQQEGGLGWRSSDKDEMHRAFGWMNEGNAHEGRDNQQWKEHNRRKEVTHLGKRDRELDIRHPRERGGLEVSTTQEYSTNLELI